MAFNESSETSKFNWEANLAARIIRNGSSLNDCSAVTGVRSTLALKSARPLKESINLGFSSVNSSAIALTVKSRRERSPSMFSPNSTSGLRDSGSYLSLR